MGADFGGPRTVYALGNAVITVPSNYPTDWAALLSA